MINKERYNYKHQNIMVDQLSSTGFSINAVSIIQRISIIAKTIKVGAMRLVRTVSVIEASAKSTKTGGDCTSSNIRREHAQSIRLIAWISIT